MTKTTLERFFIPKLIFSDQEAIAAYLDKECGLIGKKVDLLEQKADRYRRLRRAIINQAVTRGLNPNVEMKETQLVWLPKIPRHWQIKRAKEIFQERTELTETGTETLLSVSEYYGVEPRANKVDTENLTRADSLIGYKVCYVDDFVSNIMLAWKGSCGISRYDGIVSPAYGVYKPITNINSSYFHYLYRTEKYKNEFKRNSRGIIESRLRLYTPNFYTIQTIFPPISEQDEIVAYLDEKCDKIDEIVSKIELEISKLKELKRSLINEVVTGQRPIK
jgi:type I restriction enzyme S subunit